MKFGFKELLLILLLIAIPVGAYFWILKPSDELIKKQKVEVEAKKQKLADLHKAKTSGVGIG